MGTARAYARNPLDFACGTAIAPRTGMSTERRSKPSPAEKTPDQTETKIRTHQTRTHHAVPAGGAITGAAIGATVGVVAGPPGVVAGAVVGGILGAATGVALDIQETRAMKHDEELDEIIGVTSQDLGRPSQPPPEAEKKA
jgi:phage tail tape-measure protein